MSVLADSQPPHFRMRKSSAGLQRRLTAVELAEAGQFEAVIAAAGERLTPVADEVCRLPEGLAT